MEKDELTQVVSDVLKSANEAQLAEINKTVDAKLESMREEMKPKSITGGHERADDDEKAGFKTFAEFTTQVAKAARGKEDERLARIKTVSGMNEGQDLYGGYLVPTEYRRELWKLAVETSPIVNAATAIPMASNRVEVPFVDGFSDRDDGTNTVHGGIRFYWLGEAEQRTASKPKINKLALQLHKLAGMFYATDELLADSAVSIEPMIRGMFADGMRYVLENAFIWGNGAAQPQGIMNAPCLVSVAKENLQAKDTIVTENILNMYARLYRKDGAFWLINQDVFPQLPMLSIAAGTGGVPVYLPANGLAGAPYGTLLGLPVYFCDHCDTVGDQGDVILGQWSQYLIGQKEGADVVDYANSIHIRFDYDEVCYKFTTRIDGQPWWKAALATPYSANTLSPFVVLDARA